MVGVAATGEKVMDDNMIFTTFYHINDYDEAGYAALPRLIATSYPVVLWAPSGWLLGKCYYDRNNACSISPEQFINLVEEGHIHIIGREEWLTDKNYRNRQRWRYAEWLDGFDDRILAILRERESAPLSQRPVRIVEKADGEEWAEKYLNSKPESFVETVTRLIKEKKVPQGVIDKSRRALEEENERKAVKVVLGDLRNHVRAITLAEAKVPFFSHDDAEFFHLMETEGTLTDIIKKDMVISSEMGRAIIDLVEQLSSPARVSSLAGFIGTDLHRELALWFSRATDVAHNVLPKDFKRTLGERLKEHAAKGQLSERLTRQVRQGIPLFAPEVEAEADEVITWLARQAIDPDDIVGSTDIDVRDVPVGRRVLSDAGMKSIGEQNPFHSHLANKPSPSSVIATR
jgi:hypothetical protein